MSFLANDIDLEAFNLLYKQPALIKEIVPSVGKRLKFINKYNQYIEVGKFVMLKFSLKR